MRKNNNITALSRMKTDFSSELWWKNLSLIPPELPDSPRNMLTLHCGTAEVAWP